MKKNLLNERNAVIDTLHELKRIEGYTWNGIKYTNKGRYCIIFGNPNIAILLKTEPFYSFGEMFRDKGAKGVGDTINIANLKEFIQSNVKKIYLKFRDGKLYSISLLDFLINSQDFEWTQKEGTKVRSISIRHYKRVNKEDN